MSSANAPATKASSQAGLSGHNPGLSGSRVGMASSQAGPSGNNTQLTGTASEIGILTRNTSIKRFPNTTSSGVPKTFPRTPPKGTTRGALLKVTPSPYAKLVAAEIKKVRDQEEPEDDGEGPWDDTLFFRPTDKDAEGKMTKMTKVMKAKLMMPWLLRSWTMMMGIMKNDSGRFRVHLILF